MNMAFKHSKRMLVKLYYQTCQTVGLTPEAAVYGAGPKRIYRELKDMERKYGVQCGLHGPISRTNVLKNSIY